MRVLLGLGLLLLGCSSAPLDSKAGDSATPSEAAGASKVSATPASADRGAAPEVARVSVKGAPHTTYVLFYAGQSNMVGADWHGVPAGLPDPSIPFWLNDYRYDDGTHSFGPLNVSPHAKYFAHEIRTAKRLKQAGLSIAVIKLVQGATYINRWLPGAPATMAGGKVYAELSEAVAALPPQFPVDTKFV